MQTCRMARQGSVRRANASSTSTRFEVRTLFASSHSSRSYIPLEYIFSSAFAPCRYRFPFTFHFSLDSSAERRHLVSLCQDGPGHIVAAVIADISNVADIASSPHHGSHPPATRRNHPACDQQPLDRDNLTYNHTDIRRRHLRLGYCQLPFGWAVGCGLRWQPMAGYDAPDELPKTGKPRIQQNQRHVGTSMPGSDTPPPWYDGSPSGNRVHP